MCSVSPHCQVFVKRFVDLHLSGTSRQIVLAEETCRAVPCGGKPPASCLYCLLLQKQEKCDGTDGRGERGQVDHGRVCGRSGCTKCNGQRRSTVFNETQQPCGPILYP